MSASARVRSTSTSHVTHGRAAHANLSSSPASGSGSATSPTRTHAAVSVSQQHPYYRNGHEYEFGYNPNSSRSTSKSPFSSLIHPTPPSSSSPSPSRASSSISTTYKLNPTSSSYRTPVTTRPKMTRNNSHLRRTGPGALVIPIPPTLANSPHLQSPNSIFRRPHPGPRASPGVEEDMWLRDTVPIDSGGSRNGNGRETYVTVTSVSAGAVYGNGGDATEREQGRARSCSAVYPSTSNASSLAFSLLPSSLPQRTARGRG